jgi:hypothetical protein
MAANYGGLYVEKGRELPAAKPPDTLPANPMRRARFKLWVCSLLAVTLLVATSQYLTHFHVLRASAAAHFGQSPADTARLDAIQGHGAEEHCSLCLQFDRLPAPPSPQVAPAAYFFHVATLEAERLERLALSAPPLWPPSRGPPALA